MHFTKLHGEIIHSSIWDAEDHVRLVWITMLAMANWHGEVKASVPGLAQASRVPRTKCEDALKKLLGPDPDTRDGTTGERITVILGGWHIINHERYRDFRTPTQIRKAEAQSRWRAKQKADDSRQSDQCRDHVESTHLISISSPSAPSGSGEGEPERETRPKKRVTPNYDSDERFCRLWDTYGRDVSKKAAWEQWKNLAADDDLFDEIMAGAQAWAKAREPQFRPDLFRWLRDGKWSERPPVSTTAKPKPRGVQVGDPEEDW